MELRDETQRQLTEERRLRELAEAGAAALKRALQVLRNEVKGTLHAHELAIRYDSGNSNWQCLEMAIDGAEKSLSSTAGSEFLKRHQRYENALKDAAQFCRWLSEDSRNYPGTDAGNAARSNLLNIEKALAQSREAT